MFVSTLPQGLERGVWMRGEVLRGQPTGRLKNELDVEIVSENKMF